MTQQGVFRRLILPGLAFKAVVIGGGYATGRELAEFFLPCGPRGAFFAMAVSMLIWSIVCIVTFLFARATASLDYRSFFAALLGRGWIIFELAYLALLLLVLSVFGAAAGAIVHALFALPAFIGTATLAVAIALVVWHGNSSVERAFKYISILLYGCYASFLIVCSLRFGPAITHALKADWSAHSSWVAAGVNYAGYNVVGAVSILPVVRHMRSQKDAVLAGALCGPLAMLPAMAFLLCMLAFYPSIQTVTLPSDVMLSHLSLPLFRLAFQLMILFALLESGAACVNAVNQRIEGALTRRGRASGPGMRLATSALLLVAAMVIAGRFGLVTLIAEGYRALTALVLIVYIVPLLTLGTWMLLRKRAHSHTSCLLQSD